MWKILLAVIIVIILIIVFLPSIIPAPVKAIMPVYLIKVTPGNVKVSSSSPATTTPASEQFVPYVY